jgi:hypothetical protein
MQIQPNGIRASNVASLNPTPTPQTGTGEWWTVLQSALELRGAAAPRANLPAPLAEVMQYQRRIGEWQLRVELITKAADALTSSVKRLQQGTQ